MTRLLQCMTLVSVLFGAAPASAQTDSVSVKAMVERMVEVEKTAQKNQDAWAAERADVQARCASLKATVAFLKDRKATDEERVAALDQSLADLERRIAEWNGLDDSLQVALKSLCGVLEPGVLDDLPFRAGDRQMRLAELESDVARPDASPAEKVGRLFDLLQTEAAYGITSDVSEQKVAVGADTLFAQVLRVGNLSLLWRTPDGKRGGRYDRATNSWIELPANSRGRIKRAIDMASRKRPVEVISLPVGRIQP